MLLARGLVFRIPLFCILYSVHQHQRRRCGIRLFGNALFQAGRDDLLENGVMEWSDAVRRTGMLLSKKSDGTYDYSR